MIIFYNNTVGSTKLAIFNRISVIFLGLGGMIYSFSSNVKRIEVDYTQVDQIETLVYGDKQIKLVEGAQFQTLEKIDYVKKDKNGTYEIWSSERTHTDIKKKPKNQPQHENHNFSNMKSQGAVLSVFMVHGLSKICFPWLSILALRILGSNMGFAFHSVPVKKMNACVFCFCCAVPDCRSEISIAF